MLTLLSSKTGCVDAAKAVAQKSPCERNSVPLSAHPGRTPHRGRHRLQGEAATNLNTHKVASLYEAFEPAEARRLARRLELHYTPKHGSWLNIAEIELRVLSKQCLDRRIADLEILRQETKAWEHERNAKQTDVDWQFTTEEARIRLKRLYPQYQG
jgi:DDE superfamily endonuclease